MQASRAHPGPTGIAVAILIAIASAPGFALLAWAPGTSADAVAAEEGIHLVGHVALDPHFNHGVTVHKRVAYVGSFQSDPACPSGGVKAVDVSNSRHPSVLSTLATHPYTNNQQTQVVSAHTSAFHGDLLVATLENCQWFNNAPTPLSGTAGLEFWDVSNPKKPVLLSLFQSLDVAWGYSDVALVQRGSHVYAVGIAPFSEGITGLCNGTVCGLRPYSSEHVQGDVIIVDATDPRHPAMVSDWGAGKDGGLSFGAGQSPLDPPANCVGTLSHPTSFCRGGDQTAWAHTVTLNRAGTHAYVAYRDDGLLILDISDVRHPRLIAQTPQDLQDEGNTHLGAATRDERITVTSTEIYAPLFAPSGVWGEAQVFDTSDLHDPVRIGGFATRHSATRALPAGCAAATFAVSTYCGYSAHQQLISGRTVYFAWYNDGLRVVDISRPAAPVEVAHYSPPNADYIWLAKAGRLIFAVDVNRGLDVLSVPLDDEDESR